MLNSCFLCNCIQFLSTTVMKSQNEIKEGLKRLLKKQTKVICQMWTEQAKG